MNRMASCRQIHAGVSAKSASQRPTRCRQPSAAIMAREARDTRRSDDGPQVPFRINRSSDAPLCSPLSAPTPATAAAT